MRFALPLTSCCLCLGLLAIAAPAKDAPTDAPKTEAPAEKPTKPRTSDGSIEIAGQKIDYRVTAGKLQIEHDDGRPRASIFHVSYERTGGDERLKRPVMFAFNGGPGSSAVWLHLGGIGPKRVDMPGDGTLAPRPPARVIDNPFSILDVCDLVFIDPVSTGYSRADKDSKPADFHGLDEDIESVGDFIRRWVTEHDRWASPKFLLGESYGGVRAAGLASHLQSRNGMMLNGVVLLSGLLDFATMQGDLSNEVFLPSFTGVAHYHQQITGDRDALVKESAAFAFGDYAAALLKGNALDDPSRAAIAAKLARFTGIDAAVWLAHDLRLSPTFFRAELLRKQGKVIGRFDARVAWDAVDAAATSPDGDPSFDVAYGAFSTAMLDYMGRELKYKEDRPYAIMANHLGPWRLAGPNEIADVSGRLAGAIRENPHLRVLVMAGYTDLATPPEGVAHSLRHLDALPASALKNIETVHYDGGHMFYLNPPDLTKTRADLLNFIRAAAP